MKEDLDRGFPAKFYATTETNTFFYEYVMKSAKFHPIDRALKKHTSARFIYL